MEKQHFRKKGDRNESGTNPASCEKIAKEKIALIVQARLSSTRLPGKVLLPVMGKPLLFYLLERLKRVTSSGQLIVATSVAEEDNAIEQVCRSLGVACVRGELENVLNRYCLAARVYGVDLIVRITADCPLIDPSIVEYILREGIAHYPHLDYVSNTLHRTYPKGMDTEVFTQQALQKAQQSAASVYDLEHVTPYLYTHPQKFRLKSIESTIDRSSVSLVVDTEEDFRKIKSILESLYPKKQDFTLEDILSLGR